MSVVLLGATLASACASSDAATPTTTEPAVCGIERKTLEVATEAFFALTGVPPLSASQLVDAGLLRSVPLTYAIDTSTGAAEIVPVDDRCAP